MVCTTMVEEVVAMILSTTMEVVVEKKSMAALAAELSKAVMELTVGGEESNERGVELSKEMLEMAIVHSFHINIGKMGRTVFFFFLYLFSVLSILHLLCFGVCVSDDDDDEKHVL